MPKVMEIFGMSFGFFSLEGNEPPHIHVTKGDCSVKVWLADGRMVNEIGFNPNELRKIRRTIKTYRDEFYAAWYDHFGKASQG